MKVKIKIQVSGARNGQPWPERGVVVDWPDDEAASLVHAGIAAELTEDDLRALAEAEKADDGAGKVETAKADDSATETATPKAGLTTKTGPARRAPKAG